MLKPKAELQEDLNPQETSEWLEALDQIIDESGPDRAQYLLKAVEQRASMYGAALPRDITTPYVNTLPVEKEVPYPGDREIERRIKSLIRWNAQAMVVRANKNDPGIGGHIATYASQAALMEVGFNHFFRGKIGDQPGDLIYFQGHASPGMYSRAFLEGRLTAAHLENFRHELREHPGLSSYPHPWLMKDFWQFPTVSMGLGPINSIYQARFMRYLENRGLLQQTDRKIWAFLGDGETDEVESLGALTLACREKLDNLVFVVNCNLQRLDGPVRGNGKIIQELEGVFRGAGWNVIKLIWGAEWDSLLARDTTGLLLKRMGECVDGEYQAYKAKDGAYVRREFFGKYPELLELVKDLSDKDIEQLRRGGHDPHKIYNAYKAATEHRGGPTVILAKTVKGYGMGKAGEARNPSHQQKKLNEDELIYFRNRFNIPISDEQAKHCDFIELDRNSQEWKYLQERRASLGGAVPVREPKAITIKAPALDKFADALAGSQTRAVSTTMAFVNILKVLLKDPELGKLVIPIVPDEARTFGMESLFRQIGIYASQGQTYNPVDSGDMLFYHESKSGQILEEGITEAGSMGSFTAAGTSYANYGIPLIPFYIYYSMFGFQRVGDLVWAFADSRGKGFLLGATAGRTTLNGEGLQHQDGHSHVLSSTVPTCASYDPAYAYEIAVIIRDGIHRMYELNEGRFYYLTLCNQDYVQAPMPPGVEEGVLKGIYKFKAAANGQPRALLFGSGAIFSEALKASEILAGQFGVETDLYSVTSYNELRREALSVERWNRLHPDQPKRKSYIEQVLGSEGPPIIAATDYMKIVPDQLSPWLLGRLETLGTDGFGRSESREYLRRHFEVDAASIVAATLSRLARDGHFDMGHARAAMAELGIDTERGDPAFA